MAAAAADVVFDDDVDVAIVGSGVAGATLGAALGAQGLRVLVLESKRHPRFVIGESTVPSTTAGFNAIGRRFGVPELVDLTTYLGSKEVGLVSYPKSHFYFGWHAPDQEMGRHDELIFETYRPPLGPDSHLERAGLDAYLTGLLAKYGVEYRDGTRVNHVDVDSDPEGALLTLSTAAATASTSSEGKVEAEEEGEENRRHCVRAKLVVDASGHSCLLARQFGLLQSEPQLRTRTRATYGHFRVPEGGISLDDACGGPTRSFRYRRDAGTMHHCFHGGWIWVIPFDNDTVSVGLVLDLDLFPYDPSVDKNEEFWSFIKRFPTVHKHLGKLTPTRSLLRRGRIQLRSDSIIARRCLLTPHAAGFIDPLFSTGINLTSRFILRAVPLIKQFVKTAPPAPSLKTDALMASFADTEAAFKTELDFIDNMVWGTFCSFRSFRLFRAYWRVWIDATTRQIQDAQVFGKIESPLYGSHVTPWADLVRRATDVVEANHTAPAIVPRDGGAGGGATTDVRDADDVAQEVTDLLAELPSPYEHYPMRLFAPSWRVDFPHRLNVMVPVHTAEMMRLATSFTTRPLHVVWWVLVTTFTMLHFWLSYAASRLTGRPFSRHVDVVYDQLVPGGLSVGRSIKIVREMMRAFVFGKAVNAEVRKEE